MTTAKNEVFIGLTWKLLFSGGKLTSGTGWIKIWWGESTGEIFPGGGENEQILDWWGGASRVNPSVGKTLQRLCPTFPSSIRRI